MAIFKRGGIWHTHFFVDGQRFRQSLETRDWRQAQAKEKELIADAKSGKLLAKNQQFARLSFKEAAERFLQSRSLEPSESSRKKEGYLLVKPTEFFAGQVLAKITGEHLLAFREWRIKDKVEPATINMEVGVLRRILKRARRWHLVSADLKPLKEPRSIGRAMALDEKLRLLRLAAKNPDWQNARLATTLALNTTMRGCEIKQLRWRDIDLIGKALTIRKSKTDAGERVIPLNSVAYKALLELRERAKRIGGAEPQHFVCPHCENGHMDPGKPQRSWRSAWRRLTAAIECPSCGEFQNPTNECHNKECKADLRLVKSPTAGLRFHDLRHHAITELAESQASDETIMAIAGHVSPRMLAHYSHVRLDAKRNALDALSQTEWNGLSEHQPQTHNSESEQASYDTSSDTNGGDCEDVPSEVIAKYGRPEWTRTIDLFRVKEAL